MITVTPNLGELLFKEQPQAVGWGQRSLHRGPGVNRGHQRSLALLSVGVPPSSQATLSLCLGDRGAKEGEGEQPLPEREKERERRRKRERAVELEDSDD